MPPNSIVLPHKQLLLLDFRYAPATQIWRGRLHVMGGSKENRNAVAHDHWSIAVKGGKALDKWREEVPIPRGGPHRFFNTCSNHTSFCFEPPSMLLIIMGLIWFCRACVVANDKLLVIGGQEGDFMAKPNSPIFKCSRRREVFTLFFFFAIPHFDVSSNSS